MDKRFLTFTTMALLIIVINAIVMAWLRPPRPPAPAAQQAKVEAKDAPAADDKAADKVAEQAAEPAEITPASAEPKEAEAPAAQPAVGDQDSAFPERWVTIGSANSQDPYRMLATIASRGAAVERIELNNARYRDLDIKSGYLGHLEATDEPNHAGARVRLVGFGVPADEAGLKEGDVIQSVADQPTPDAKRLWAVLGTTKPGQTVKVAILRGGVASELSVKLGRKPLDVVRPEYERKDLESIDGKHDPLSLILTLDEVGAEVLGDQKEELAGVNLLNGNWEIVDRDGVRPSQSEVTLERTLASRGVRIRKTFTLAQVKEPENADDPAFHLKVKIEVTNLGTEKRALAYRMIGPTGLPIEGAWYANKVNRISGSELRTVLARVKNEQPAEFGESLLSGKSPPEPWITPALEYAGCDSQYFAAALIPEPKQPGTTWFAQMKPLIVGQVSAESAEKRLTNVSFRLTSVPESLEPGASLTHNYTFFAGPKRPNLLGQYAPPEVPGATQVTLRDFVYYGWTIFALFAEPMQRILHMFYSITSSYGLAILMLTVVVRGAMFPLSRRQAISTQKMQDLQPEIKRINEKFKKDPQAKNKAVQELFRKNNCNPLGGCLPALIQLPIFMGLYRSLAVDVELRQAPLLGSAIAWCSNLAAPDMLWDWTTVNMPAIVVNFLGPYFNILPLITIGLFILQQRMFMPPPADEQAAMQQKMMQFMMVFMGVMFFKVASGLCVYFIASSVWSICERKLIPKTLPTKGQPSAEAKAANPGGNGATSRRQRERK